MEHETSVNAALAVMDAHITGLNAQDPDAIAATLHFPHFRLSGTTLKTWDTPARYFDDFKARAGGDWARSAFKDMRVAQASKTKVHLDVEVQRFNKAGEQIAKFRSLWVLTLEGEKWAAKFRSSFAAS